MESTEARVALVTGASRGIGRASALALAARGIRVVVTARTEAMLAEVVSDIEQAGGQAMAVAGDASAAEDVTGAIDAALAAYGRIDILLNNAGIGILGPLEQMSVEDFDRQMATNFRSVFLYCRGVIPHMEKAGQGHIVNIASISGLKAFRNASVYCASKFATIGLTRALDIELRERNIKVTAICPAGVDTEWAIGTGLEREAVAELERLRPETIADAVVYAVSQPANARVTELIIYPMVEEGHQ